MLTRNEFQTLGAEI